MKPHDAWRRPQHDEERLAKLERLKTGVEGLDTLLHGGLVAGASYIIQGRPGSGKTVLANQIAFSHAEQGGRVLFAALLSESHERLFHFLSTMDFFQRERIGGEIQYVSAFDTLENEGLDAVVRLLRREISRQKASLLVIDGLLNARSRAETALDTKKFIAELQGHATFAGCTVLFLTSAPLDDSSPEHTMVDGVIELGEDLYGSRALRRLHLRKTRGSGGMLGLHQFTISERGLRVFPRLEACVRPLLSGRSDEPTHRLPTGVTGLDAMVGGGWVASSSTMLMGPSGAGKTSLALAFAACATTQSPALYFSLCETPSRLERKGDTLGLGIGPAVRAGALHFMWRAGIEDSLDALGHELLERVDSLGAGRVVVDGLGALRRNGVEPARWAEFLAALVDRLRELGVTVLLLSETADQFNADRTGPSPDLAGVVDNLVLIRFVDTGVELRRSLAVIKVREGAHDARWRDIEIDGRGVQILAADPQRRSTSDAPSSEL